MDIAGGIVAGRIACGPVATVAIENVRLIDARDRAAALAAAQSDILARVVRNEPMATTLDAIIQTGADQGMQTMDRTLVSLVQSGTVTYDSAREFAVDLTEFERLMRG